MTTQAEALLADRPDLEAGVPLLSVRDLRTNLLKPASFTLSAGECVVIRGPSGGGKTLLLRALADLDPNEGRPASGLRLALARALMVRPKVLLLDEPTAALDPASVGRSRNWSARA